MIRNIGNVIVIIVIVLLISCDTKIKEKETNVNFNLNYYRDSSNTLSYGYMKDSLKEGLWHVHYENGDIYSIGNYMNNRRVGLWKFFFKKTIEVQLYFVNDTINGSINTYKNGRLIKTEFANKGRYFGRRLEFIYSTDNEIIDTVTYPVSPYLIIYDQNP